MLPPVHVSARRSPRVYNLAKHKICASPNCMICRSTLIIWIWTLAFCLCNPFVFLLFSMDPILPLTLVAPVLSRLPCIARYRRCPSPSSQFAAFFQKASETRRTATESPTRIILRSTVYSVQSPLRQVELVSSDSYSPSSEPESMEVEFPPPK